ncbi:MAG: hypothetical protein MJ252_05630 [archaeon]|nr:hypothetical protein [archaeon]
MLPESNSSSTLPFSLESHPSSQLTNIQSGNQMNDLESSPSQSSLLNSLIGSISLQNLNIYYGNNSNGNKEKSENIPNQNRNFTSQSINLNNCAFKQNIDKLNIKFYEESEKIIECKSAEEVEKIHNKLFLILFKQISIYIKEIERLNKKIIELNNSNRPSIVNNLNLINPAYSANIFPKKIYNSVSKSKKKSLKEEKNKSEEEYTKTINCLKNEMKILEIQLHEKKINEERKREEISNLKKEILNYKIKENNLKNIPLKEKKIDSSLFLSKFENNRKKRNTITNSNNLYGDINQWNLSYAGSTKNNNSNTSSVSKNSKRDNSNDLNNSKGNQHNVYSTISGYYSQNSNLKKSIPKIKNLSSSKSNINTSLKKEKPKHTQIKLTFVEDKRISKRNSKSPKAQSYTPQTENSQQKENKNNFEEESKFMINLYNEEFNDLCLFETFLLKAKKEITKKLEKRPEPTEDVFNICEDFIPQISEDIGEKMNENSNIILDTEDSNEYTFSRQNSKIEKNINIKKIKVNKFLSKNIPKIQNKTGIKNKNLISHIDI